MARCHDRRNAHAGGDAQLLPTPIAAMTDDNYGSANVEQARAESDRFNGAHRSKNLQESDELGHSSRNTIARRQFSVRVHPGAYSAPGVVFAICMRNSM